MKAVLLLVTTVFAAVRPSNWLCVEWQFSKKFRIVIHLLLPTDVNDLCESCFQIVKPVGGTAKKYLFASRRFLGGLRNRQAGLLQSVCKIIDLGKIMMYVLSSPVGTHVLCCPKIEIFRKTAEF